MGTLIHAFEDLLTFGTIVIVAMVVGGILVILAIIADSVWLIREARNLGKSAGTIHRPGRREGGWKRAA
jgi:hypothetical protein